MSQKIKLLSIIETLTRGGAERVLVDTLPALVKLGFECEVAIIFEKDDLANELEVNGIKVHRLNLSYKWNIFEGTYKLFKLVKKEQYDIVHAHLFFAYFYTALVKSFYWKIKTVVTFHSMTFKAYPPDTIWKNIRKKLDCFILNNLFDMKTSVSRAVQEHFKKYCNIEDINIIPNSFPLDKIYLFKNKKYNNIDKNKFIILTPGRIIKEKGHKYLIEAINILNKKHLNLEFLFVGRGPLIEILKKNAPKNLNFISEMPHSELMKLYNEVDMIVIPSIYEAFGLVVGEAMIMEKSIVATKVDGIIEMIDDKKEGLLVESKDSVSLAKAIDRLYQDKQLQKKLIKNATLKIQQFDTKKIAIRWKEFYIQILEKEEK